jgi:hypothetical protein
MTRSPILPLQGMTFKLERKTDLKEPCCSDFAIVAHPAELLCKKCGKHRGSLSPEATSWILNFLAFWPEARFDVHVLRDSKRR